jgi:hypothetical protein
MNPMGLGFITYLYKEDCGEVIKAYRRMLEIIVQRHEVFRTVFEIVDESLYKK